MTARFTNRPWVVAPDPGRDCDECGATYAETYMVGWSLISGMVVGLATVLADDREEANAHLIAAAPDLYAACEAAMLACQDNLKMWAYKNEPALHDAFVKCKAALAKARGEASP